MTVADIEHQSRLVSFGNIGDTGIVGYGWLAQLSITYDVARGRARLTVGQTDSAAETPDDESTINLR